MTIMRRGGTLTLCKKVPKRYAGVEPRKQVWIALGTDSEKEAKAKAEEVWEAMCAGWEALRKGDSPNAEERFEAARELAHARGFRYRSAEAVARMPVEEIMARLAEVRDLTKDGKPTLEAEAMLGGAKSPSLKLSKVAETYFDLTKDRLIGKSEEQVRRWENPRKRAMKTLIDIVGDKPVDELDTEDMLDFRNWWMEKLSRENMSANSANKDITHVSDMLKTVNKLKRLGLDLPLGGMAFKESGSKEKSWPPFSDEWIKTKLMAPGALGALNDDAKYILLGMINTGYRPSEGAHLTAETIRLDGAVPYIMIRADGRQTKNENSIRDIPLTGVSLEAFKAMPKGFPRYRGNSATLSATLNKFLKAHGLLETDRHRVYSLRHSFEDRMLANSVDERIRRDVFGHSLNRERYGKGASLEHVHGLLKAFAL